MHAMRQVFIGTLVMALVSAFADAFWAAAIPEHRAAYGLAHGAIVLGVLGFVLARLGGSRRAGLGALAGMLIGAGAAALFYVLYVLAGNLAIVVAWMALWLAFAFLNDALSSDRESFARTLTRGVIAAVLSGVAFGLVSDMWLGPHDPGPLYVRNFAYWFVAFLPGLAALLLRRLRG